VHQESVGNAGGYYSFLHSAAREKEREEELSITCDTTSSKSKVSQLFILYSVALSGNIKV